MNLLKILDGTPEPPIIDLQLDVINDSGDYHLATPMYEFQKELTDQIISLHYPDILKYCETNDTKELIVKSLEICIENCMLVSTHPYLLINHYMPKNLSQKEMHRKLADTSGKFNVLRDLVNVIILLNPTRAKNIAVVMKNDMRFFDLTEALLLGCTGNRTTKRYVGHNVQRESKKASKTNGETNAGTTIHLLPGDGNLQKDTDSLSSIQFDTLIVFDSYVDTSTNFFSKLRTQNRRGEAVVIRLVPMKTIEHCKLYYHNDQGKHDYLYNLISSIVCLREFIGNMPPDVFPIYNQKLTYLSTKFFDEIYRSSARCSFPAWPLPELPKIPKFSAVDVERSLLTEVHFHYTPYDSADYSNDNIKPEKTKKRLYYEMKRLELDYVSNPLKNDLNSLIGIQSGSSSKKQAAILTHKLFMQLNNAYMAYFKADQEYRGHLRFNEEEIQQRVGRREGDILLSLSKILSDVDHAESRVHLANTRTAKIGEELAHLNEQNNKREQDLKNYAETTQSEQDKKYIANQLEIWQLQGQIKDLISLISNKNDEKVYMTKEYETSKVSIEESRRQIEAIGVQIAENNDKLTNTLQQVVDDDKTYTAQKQKLLDSIAREKKRRDTIETNLSSALKYLKDTSHLKKRKGRGLTPNSK